MAACVPGELQRKVAGLCFGTILVQGLPQPILQERKVVLDLLKLAQRGQPGRNVANDKTAVFYCQIQSERISEEAS